MYSTSKVVLYQDQTYQGAVVQQNSEKANLHPHHYQSFHHQKQHPQIPAAKHAFR